MKSLSFLILGDNQPLIISIKKVVEYWANIGGATSLQEVSVFCYKTKNEIEKSFKSPTVRNFDMIFLAFESNQKYSVGDLLELAPPLPIINIVDTSKKSEDLVSQQVPTMSLITTISFVMLEKVLPVLLDTLLPVKGTSLSGFIYFFENDLSPTIITTLEGWILYVNKAAHLLIKKIDINECYCGNVLPWKKVAESNIAQIFEETINNSYLEISAVFFRLNASYVRYTLRDVTATKLIQQVLEYDLDESNKKIDNQNEILNHLKTVIDETETKINSRDLFFASLSHEIRTPLTSVIGYTELLLSNKNLPKQAVRALNAIMKNGNYLLELLNNVIDFSKLETHHIELQTQSLSLFTLLNEVEKILAVRAKNKRIYLTIVYKYPLPENIDVDGMRLKQILINLVGNAIKFTYQGGVTVSVQHDENSKGLIFSVIDTGIGIPKNTQPFLFDIFSQGNLSHEQGFGLGLFLSQKLAGLFETQIKLLYTSNQGSAFSFVLPLSTSDKAKMLVKEPAQDPIELSSFSSTTVQHLAGSVLFAEDSSDARHLVVTFLKEIGVEAYTVTNGREALEFLEHNEVDIILMDMQMPILTGHEVVKTLRSQGYKKPIIAFTAEISSVNALGIETLWDATLAKPFPRRDLYSILKKFLCVAPSGTLTTEAQEETLYLESRLSSKNVLTSSTNHTINSEALRARLLEGIVEDGGSLLTASVLTSFFNQTKSRLKSLCAAREKCNIKVARQIALELKASQSFGFKELSLLANSLFKELSKGTTFSPEADRIFKKIETEIVRIVPDMG
jgi:signal transduction histidine kinase/DNA-binding response OmpR family regulator